MGVDDIRKHLLREGYADSLLVDNFVFECDHRVRLAAFAQEPVDARSACLAVVEGSGDPTAAVLSCRGMGAPVVLICQAPSLQCWKQASDRPEKLGQFELTDLAGLFQKYDLSPEAVYRAKTRGRFDFQYRLPFVDFTLMPLIESHIGAQLGNLVEHVVRQLRESLCPAIGKLTPQIGQRLVQSAFWLLAGKILHDKKVPSFKQLDLSNVTDVFSRVAAHYGASLRLQITKAEQRAFERAAERVASLGHMGHVTTESLAYVYENALITKDTRTKLGTHSTPAYLVDYIVWQLASWIDDIPVADRHVFEPACGHAAFMVSAMRLLRELLPEHLQATRRQYLRHHLHGIEVDPFALEIARLSLTLADIPNPNGWDLVCRDMFAEDALEEGAKQSTIFLTNPPFEDFVESERRKYARQGINLRYLNKTAETLGRALPNLPTSAVIGLVVPQSILYSKSVAELRAILAKHFELSEVCLFPDKVFKFSDAESAIILGRKLKHTMGRARAIRYQRVRESDLERFRDTYAVSQKKHISPERFSQEQRWNMLLPDMEEVWDYLRESQTLSDIADVGEGLSYRKNVPTGTPTWAKRRFPGAVKGFMRIGRDLLIHTHPHEMWMSVARDVLNPARRGADLGLPQVLTNRPRVSRGPWRIKAFIDRDGHAFTDNYNVVRPKHPEITLECLWAILNSPLANAFTFAHATGRHNLPGTLKRLPLPDMSKMDLSGVVTMVNAYLSAAARADEVFASGEAKHEARDILMEIDAAVLKGYKLPPRLEREVLDLFAAHQRAGVAVEFVRYFPEDFEPCFSLYDYLSQEYQRSTAGELRARHEDVSSPGLLKAMKRAVDDYGE